MSRRIRRLYKTMRPRRAEEDNWEDEGRACPTTTMRTSAMIYLLRSPGGLETTGGTVELKRKQR